MMTKYIVKDFMYFPLMFYLGKIAIQSLGNQCKMNM